jgi:cysteinyl-tRNA synthetase
VTPAPTLRLYLLSQSYRTPFTYLPEQVGAAVKRWRRWVEARQAAARCVGDTPALQREPEEFTHYREEFIAAMDDDFNTSGGMAVVDTLVRRLNDFTGNPVPGQEREQRELARGGLAVLDELTGILGIALDPALERHRTIDDATRAQIETLVDARTKARQARNWQEADRIRQELHERFGVIVQDGPIGSTWKVE